MRDGAQVVDLQIGGGAGPPSAKMASQRDADSSIRQGRHHAAMHHASHVLQLVAHRAFDSYTVRMPADHAQTNQLVESHVLRYMTQVSSSHSLYVTNVARGHAPRCHCMIEE
jgi:hypothetical protein